MKEAGLRPDFNVRVTFDEEAAARSAPAADDAFGGEREAQAQIRLRLALIAFACAFSLLGLRLAVVSFGAERETVLLAGQDSSGPRAEVTDRLGRALILNRETMGLAVDGRDVWDVEETVSALLRVFPDIDAGRLRRLLNKRAYAFVRSEITPEERTAVLALGLPGMRFPEGSARVYPQGQLGAHILGYTIPGRGGAVGVEKAIDETGGTQAVRLTLDTAVQQVVEDELAEAIATFSAKAGWGVMMDARDGSIVALASLPDFDPNRPGDFPAAARRNRAMSDAYELGSAFKPITAAAAWDLGLVRAEDRFDVTHSLKVGDWTIEDYTPKAARLTVSEILQYSSNIGTVKIVERLGAARFEETLRALSLTEALETELPESRAPLLPQRWGPAELATASYGHGLAVTPLQLTAAFAAVVNGGMHVTPRTMAATPVERRQVFSPETSAAMRLALRRVVTDGTGRNAEAEGFHAIGKTATADKPGAGGYGGRRLVSSFIGAFPGYDPQYVLLISLDEPEGIAETYGFATAGYTAAPVFRRVVERAAPLLGLMPAGDDVALDAFVGLGREAAAETVAPAEGDDEARAAQAEPLDPLARLLTETTL